jgi:hypothetical protein
MLSMAGIVGAIAIALAVLATSVIVGVCLLIGWVTDAARGTRGHPQGGAPGGAQYGGGAPGRGLPPASHRKRDGLSRTAGR